MFDPVLLELLWARLVSIVDEAAATLLRSSFSTVVRESHDFGCVLTDAQGRSVVQATDSVPSFLCTLPNTIRHFLQEFPPETLQPGDVLITNDIWMGTGHLPDISVAKPIFSHGRLVGFAGSVAHSPDIGGRIRSAEARDIFEAAMKAGLIEANDADQLIMAHAMMRDLFQWVRLTLEDGNAVTSASKGLKHQLAVTAGLPDFNVLSSHLRETQKIVRHLFNQMMA